MSRRPSALLCTLWLAVPLTVSAQDLSPEDLARIRLDEKAALKKIDDAHGGKKPSEMSNAERRQVIEEQRAAVQEVKDKHGVSEKDYARQTARMGPRQNAAVAEAEKSLDAQRKAAAKQSAPEEPVVVEIRGEYTDPERAAPEESALPPGDVPVVEEVEIPVVGAAPTEEGAPPPAETP